MKLSDAILLGSTLSPQAFRKFEDAKGNRCALGAALAAVGAPTTDDMDAVKALSELWPWAARPLNRDCPVGDPQPRRSLVDMILYLNDAHYWPRERIAAWVRTLEPQDSGYQEAPSIAAPAAPPVQIPV